MELQIEQMNPFFTKYHINPEGKLPITIRPVIHHFTEADTGEEAHCHPFDFWSYVLDGGYMEEVFFQHGEGDWDSMKGFRAPHTAHFVKANTIHKITQLTGSATTLIVPGPKVKEPCFYRFEDGKAFVRQWNEKEFKPFNP